jgi:Acyl-CoA dehydrogenases
MTSNPSHFDSMLADVARFVREEAIPRENEIEQADAVPADLVERMRELGYFGWSIPRDFGGAGLSTEQLVRGAFELSQASVAFRARVGTNTGIGRKRSSPTAPTRRSNAICRVSLGRIDRRFRVDRSRSRL